MDLRFWRRDKTMIGDEKDRQKFLDGRASAENVILRVVSAAAACQTKPRECHRGREGPTEIVMECLRGPISDPLAVEAEDVIACLPGWLAPLCSSVPMATGSFLKVKFKEGQLEEVWPLMMKYEKMVVSRQVGIIKPTLEQPRVLGPGDKTSDERAAPGLAPGIGGSLEHPKVIDRRAGEASAVDITGGAMPVGDPIPVPTLQDKDIAGTLVTGIILDPKTYESQGITVAPEAILQCCEDLKNGRVTPHLVGMCPVKYWVESDRVMGEFQVTSVSVFKNPPTQFLNKDQLSIYVPELKEKKLDPKKGKK